MQQPPIEDANSMTVQSNNGILASGNIEVPEQQEGNHASSLVIVDDDPAMEGQGNFAVLMETQEERESFDVAGEGRRKQDVSKMSAEELGVHDHV